jgi:hypothetical protein
MQLPPEQTARFYRIWLALLRYVNEQLHLVSAFPVSEERGVLLPLSDELQLRNALWADDTLRERFISSNPAGLSSTDLAVVTSWRYRLAGSFYIVRTLKKYTVFLSEDTPPRAYGVLGLSSPIEELARDPLPVLAQTVLLPFEDKIIYDGLLQWYAVVFGPGIRARLNTEYRNAQEREGIITTLEPANHLADPQKMRTGVLVRNGRIVRSFRKGLSSKRLSPKMVEQHVSTIENFAQTSLLALGLPITVGQRQGGSYGIPRLARYLPPGFGVQRCRCSRASVSHRSKTLCCRLVTMTRKSCANW